MRRVERVAFVIAELVLIALSFWCLLVMMSNGNG